MAFLNGTLQLLEPAAPRGQRLPIDFFFRSLAQDQHERAIGIVLSGTGSDGTLGVRAIKGEGGMVMAQSPESTEFDGMPRSAIATGLVDYELPPAEMPAQLIAYVAHAFGKPPRLGEHAGARDRERAEKDLHPAAHPDRPRLLPVQAEHHPPPHRAAHGRAPDRSRWTTTSSPAAGTPPEVEALFRDLLIGVTNFFRDPEAFQVLEEQVIPKLFADKPAGAAIRVWSRGLLDRRGGLLDRHPAAGAHGGAQAKLHGAGLRHRHRQPGDRHGARRGSIRPASPPTSRRSGWRAFSRRSRTAAPTASTRASATCWSSPSRT